MSKSNRSIKQRMIAKYGKECWIDKLHIRKDDTPRVYKNKGQLKRAKQLTFHHIRERSKGGKATEENGAILSAENHAWFHKQPKEIRDKINQMFQDYKKTFGENSTDSSYAGTNSSTNIEEINYDEFISLAKSRYNRAKDKREFQKRVEEELEDLER